jgi:hypothetical protein
MVGDQVALRVGGVKVALDVATSGGGPPWLKRWASTRSEPFVAAVNSLHSDA